MRIRSLTVVAAAALMLAGGAAMAGPVGLIDDFSGDLSAYTSTVILDANGGGSNVAAWQIAGGTLQLNTTSYDGIEQTALIRSGLALGVGEEVQVDLVHTGASQDLGLYVGGTTPVTGTRQDYIAMYARSNGQVFSRGFDGTSEYPLAGGSSPAYDSLFIARTALDTYEAGYYEAGVRNVVATRTPATLNAGTVVGFYADVRATGVLGSADNLRVVPEPATLSLLGVGALTLLRRRRQQG